MNCKLERDQFIKNNLGNFSLIFPPLNNPRKLEYYEAILTRAEHVYHRFTGAGDTAQVIGFKRMLKNVKTEVSISEESPKSNKKGFSFTKSHEDLFIYHKNKKFFKNGKTSNQI